LAAAFAGAALGMLFVAPGSLLGFTVASSASPSPLAGQGRQAQVLPRTLLRSLPDVAAAAAPPSSRRLRLPRRSNVPKVRLEKGLEDDLPWPRETAEIMVDSMSFSLYLFKKAQERLEPEGIYINYDKFLLWPAWVWHAVKKLVPIYGFDRPPAPWKPVILVHDIPDMGPGAHSYSGLRVRRWQNLKKQGPREIDGVTLAWAGTYNDISARGWGRCDQEILTMLEALTRDFPRRQVLVSGQPMVRDEARRYCEVRSPAWLEKEIRRSGSEGEKIIEEILSSKLDLTEELKKKNVKHQVRDAWLCS